MTRNLELEKTAPKPLARYYFLDWLRLFAILFVFLIHCSKFFDYHTVTVFNTVRSPVLSAFREFVLLWVMPFFFIISGASIFLSLKSLNAGEIVKTRIQRLLIPLLFIGTFIINPPYIYFERLFDGWTTASFFQWYPHFFNGIYPNGNFVILGMGTHLWYLQYLFFFSLILLPLFIQSKKTGKNTLTKISSCFEKPWALFFLFIPIAAAAVVFESNGLGRIRIIGGWDPLSYLICLIYGYMLFSNTTIIKTIKQYYAVYLMGAIVLTIFYIDTHFGLHLNIPGITCHNVHQVNSVLPSLFSMSTAIQAFRGLLVWLWIIGLLGLGIRFFSFKNQFIVYGNKALLPFYILHHSIILLIGSHVIQWDNNITSKFLVISSISFAIIMVLYELLIKRITLLRFLFGMKAKFHKH